MDGIPYGGGVGCSGAFGNDRNTLFHPCSLYGWGGLFTKADSDKDFSAGEYSLMHINALKLRSVILVLQASQGTINPSLCLPVGEIMLLLEVNHLNLRAGLIPGGGMYSWAS